MVYVDSEVYVTHTLRSPSGRFLGSLKDYSASDIAAAIVAKLFTDSDGAKTLLDHIEHLIIGNVVSAGMGQAPARQVAIKAGLPPRISCLTINKVCASGLMSVVIGANFIKANTCEAVIVGGMESMSQAPFYIKGMREGVKYGEQKLQDGLIYDGLFDAYESKHMGDFADYTARFVGITRQEQDDFALSSQQKAFENRDKLACEILNFPPNKNSLNNGFAYDETVRKDTTLDKLSSLKPAFSLDGTVTAGNSSPLSDGAAVLILCSGRLLNKLGLKPLAQVSDFSFSGLPPQEIFFTPARSIANLLKKTATTLKDYSWIEINEAFAAQVIANVRELGLSNSLLNPYGGSIALGHPLGASGARVLVTMINGLTQKGGGKGIAALCLGGGNSVALSIKVT
jgi:acetyl-CoA C-acetyltransferase